jgi:predicted RNA methylase
MDRHFTPEFMATYLVARIAKRPTLVADFAAGEGALLKAARLRWPLCNLIATDLDRRAVFELAALEKSIAGKCDFLSTRSRAGCRALKQRQSEIDVVLLNPPFSCRGNSYHLAELCGEQVKCSTAMAFVIGATHYLNRRGHIAAILPASCMTSDKDANARIALSKTYSIEWQRFDGEGNFPGCEVSVVLLYLRPGAGERRAALKPGLALVQKQEIHAHISRGTFPMDQAKTCLHKRGLKLIHSTGLVGHRVEHTHRVNIQRSFVDGPAIFLPRVGRFNPSKISLKPSPERVAISDCIIALQTTDSLLLPELFQRLLASASYLGASYEGSCAKYTTIERLTDILRNINVVASRNMIACAEDKSQTRAQQRIVS